MAITKVNSLSTPGQPALRQGWASRGATWPGPHFGSMVESFLLVCGAGKRQGDSKVNALSWLTAQTGQRVPPSGLEGSRP